MNTKPKAARPRVPGYWRGLRKLLCDIGPYFLAFIIFFIAARYALNPVAQRYADQLFALALLAAKLTQPPQPPAPPAP
jgi:hypothetical protein